MKTVLSILITSILFACGTAENETGNDTEGLSGKWEVVKAEGMLAADNVGTVYFFEDGFLTLSKDDFDNKAKSVVTDSTFTWDNGSMISIYNYHFEGSKLIVNPDGSEQFLTLKKN
jgi:hypothetical protein